MASLLWRAALEKLHIMDIWKTSEEGPHFHEAKYSSVSLLHLFCASMPSVHYKSSLILTLLCSDDNSPSSIALLGWLSLTLRYA